MSTENSTHKVGVIMGSSSDLKVMHQAADALAEFGIEAEVAVVSAHRTPEAMVEYAKAAAGRGLRVIIAGAGGAAHLPGMVASMTTLPVIGVPIKSSNSIDGWDSVTGKVVGEPSISAKGFSEDPGAFSPVIPLLTAALHRSAEDGITDTHQLQQVVRRTVGRWVNDAYRRRPMIVPTVVEV